MTSGLSEFGETAPEGPPGQNLRAYGLRRSRQLHDELTFGQQKLNALFRDSQRHTFKPAELLGTANGWSDGIYYLRAGWASQFRHLGDGLRAIVDVYLPGDVIGLDRILRLRPLEDVLTLTSVTIEAIPVEDALVELMTDQQIVLYLVWLLGRRQQRTDRLLAAISCLDARGRLAMMMLDFFTRLRRRKLITGSMYNLPLTQVQIGQYLGLTVVHINRVLRALRDAEIANLEKHCVTIIDLGRLTRLAHGHSKFVDCVHQ